MMTTNEEAFEMIVGHHRELREHVARLVGGLDDAVANGRGYGVARAELVSYLVGEVLPHALAEEDTVYALASTNPMLTATVASMVDDHRNLALGIERLAGATSGIEAVRDARSFAALFDAHVTSENEVLLPPLVNDETVDVAQLLTRMQQLTQVDPGGTSPASDGAGSDLEAVLFTQLLAAATMLARAGDGDVACSMVAATWAALRVPRPDLADKATHALHRLVRMVNQEPVALRAREATSDVVADIVLDVRSLAPAQRHERIFATYEGLSDGAAFMLINDHDPKPLRYQFEAEHTDEFTWDYVESGPKVWQVRIGRVAAHGAPVSTGRRV